MLDHKCYQLGICIFLRCESQFAINRLALSEEIARTDLHLAYPLRKFLLCERLDVVIDLREIHSAFSEKLVHLATFGTRWFFVDCDLIRHNLYCSLCFLLRALRVGSRESNRSYRSNRSYIG